MPPPTPTSPPDALRVVSANAASGRDQRTGAVDLAPWGRALAGLGADVVAVQEVDHLLPRSGGTDQTALLAAACAAGGEPWTARFAAAVHGTPGDRRTFDAAPTTVPDRPSYGVALLSRHPVGDWRELRMAPSVASLPVLLPPGSPSRVLWAPDEQRVALAARVAHPGGDLTVVATHLSFAPTRAAGQLRELVAWAVDLPRPLVLLGDLNLPGGWPARLTGWTPALRAPTFPSGRPRVQLDHVLLDDPAGVLTVTGSGTVVLAGGDHRGARVDLART